MGMCRSFLLVAHGVCFLTLSSSPRASTYVNEVSMSSVVADLRIMLYLCSVFVTYWLDSLLSRNLSLSRGVCVFLCLSLSMAQSWS